MFDEQKEVAPEFQDWFDGADIFLRSKAKQRFQLSLEAGSHGDRGLAVIGGNDGVLDHYSRMLVARLRDLEGFQLEVFLPNDTDSLLNRFNQILAKMTMEQARKLPEASAPVHLLVVNDAKSVKQDQWHLLVRLITDFPGINVRLILCIDKTGWPGYEKLLAMFGRQLYRWVVDTPTVDEAIQLMYAAREHGYESDTESLLDQIGLGDVVAPDDSEIMPGDIDILSEDTLMQDIGGGLVFPDDPFNFDGEKQLIELDQGSGAKPSKLRDFAFVATICLLSLVVTMFVIYRFNPVESMLYRDAAFDTIGKWRESLASILSDAPKDADAEIIIDNGAVLFAALDDEVGGTNNNQLASTPLVNQANISGGRGELTPTAESNIADDRVRAAPYTSTEQRLEDISQQFAAVSGEQNRLQQMPEDLPIDASSESPPSPANLELRKQLGQIEALLAAVERERILVAEQQTELGDSLESVSQSPVQAQQQSPAPIEQITQAQQRAPVAQMEPLPIGEVALGELLVQTALAEQLVPIDPIRALDDEIVTVIEAPTQIQVPVAVDHVQSSRSTDFFIQYIVFTSRLQATSFIDDYVGLAGALVVPISLRGNPAYAVVTGPFNSMGEAKKFAGGERLPKDYWYRSAAQLKGALRTDE